MSPLFFIARTVFGLLIYKLVDIITIDEVLNKWITTTSLLFMSSMSCLYDYYHMTVLRLIPLTLSICFALLSLCFLVSNVNVPRKMKDIFIIFAYVVVSCICIEHMHVNGNTDFEIMASVFICCYSLYLFVIFFVGGHFKDRLVFLLDRIFKNVE